MKKKERGELYAYGTVLDLVERQVSSRNGITVAGLRVLLRVAALTDSGALVRGTDVVKTGIGATTYVTTQLQYLRKGERWLRLAQGGKIAGYYVLTPTGKQVCSEYATAWRRAADNLQRFEPASPFRRLKPLK